MRCFYCGRSGQRASKEHIPSAFLGSRLSTRKVCADCNARADREIDNPMASYVMVQMPRALADVRNIRKQGKAPQVGVDGVESVSGDPVKLRFDAGGMRALRLDGSPSKEVVEVAYPMDSDRWVQFIAKVALGCAAKLFDGAWIDTRIAAGLRSLLWHGRIDNGLWSNGVGGWTDELEQDNPVRQALGDNRHLIGLTSADNDPHSSVAVALLFGGQIRCELSLPGVTVPGSGPVWVLDWRDNSPPQPEDFDAAIERMLLEKGWSGAQINAARLR